VPRVNPALAQLPDDQCTPVVSPRKRITAAVQTQPCKKRNRSHTQQHDKNNTTQHTTHTHTNTERATAQRPLNSRSRRRRPHHRRCPKISVKGGANSGSGELESVPLLEQSWRSQTSNLVFTPSLHTSLHTGGPEVRGPTC